MTNQSTFADKLERMLNRAETMRRTYLEMRMRPDDVKILIAALRAPRSAQEPVAWTNRAQLGFLRAYPGVPMAMWSKQSKAADVPLYALTGDTDDRTLKSAEGKS